MYELDPYKPVARSNTSGSWRYTHSSFGPTAWLDSNVPARSRIFCSPNSSVSKSISAVARVSMPYRMAGRNGRRSSSHNTRHGPTPLTHRPATLRPRRNRGHQFGADVADLAPPHTLGVHLGPPRPWQVHRVGDRLRSQNRAGGVDEYALRAPCPHIDTDQHVHVATLRPGATTECWPTAASRRGSPTWCSLKGRSLSAPPRAGHEQPCGARLQPCRYAKRLYASAFRPQPCNVTPPSSVSARHGTLAGIRGSPRTPRTVVRHAARGCTARRAPGQ